MYDNSAFEQMISVGNPTGEVIGVERFLIKIKGLDGAPVGALAMLQTGQHCVIREIRDGYVLALNLDTETTSIGTLVVLEELELTTPVGEAMIGRVVNPLGQPLDGKGELTLTESRHVFAEAPGIHERSILKDQLFSGVTMVDMLFPVVLGQRIAVLGDTKSGKSSFLMQLGVNQTGSDRIVVYVLIGKRRVEIDQTISQLNETGAIQNSIVVVANIFDSLAQSYIAPYVGCAIAEHLWHGGRDVVVVYDDLSSHAKIHREVSLLAKVNPGRDSYPGDMFYSHSSLLERAGKLASNEKTLTALPVVVTPGDDITAYLPTSIMSITDGQIIFDLATFRRNIRPAVKTGLSVSRVGGRAQTTSQKRLSTALMQRLAAYQQAQEFAHFGSDMSAESKQTLELGKQIYEALRQTPTERLSIVEQEIMLRAIVLGDGKRSLNVMQLKQQAHVVAETVQNEADIERLSQEVLEQSVVEAAT
ncbi:TPA: sodium-transporting two-sector ATPase [Candidatus Saccharibacteria bacterium]|nr:sodium-transporting two-sector ATPase [Candidatus Saccharibacteria bacterium]HRK41325.1 sodium-transporting two-sector ATPase [Candidatus Saccharibacteria bacterium]